MSGATRFPVEVTIERDVPAAMRDGTILYADIYRPTSDGPLPALLMRLPYDKVGAQTITYAHPIWYARQGFLVIVQDVRGRGRSEGEFYPFRHEAEDGYDTVEWAATVPGCNGAVGMFGFSYVGVTQLLPALLRPPHLVTIAPAFTNDGYYEGWTYQGGALNLAFAMSWATSLAPDTARRRGQAGLEASLAGTFADIAPWYWFLPLRDFPILQQEAVAPYFYDWLEHPTDDPYWQEWEIARRYPDIAVPALHIGGWYDVFLEGTLRNFRGLREQAGSAEARRRQRLVIGPWYHMPWTQQVGAVDFGPEAQNSIDDLQVRWFSHWLKGEDNGMVDEPPVRLFVMGENRWRDEEEWPIARAVETPLHLHSDGRANSASGNGTLSAAAPTEEYSDIFVYDPAAPVPSLGGHSCCFPQIAPMGPADQRSVEARNDVLVYTGEVLTRDLEVTGPVHVILWAASTAVDTDFTAKLVDVYPDGTAVNLCDGLIRARFRDSLRRPEPIVPDRVYEFPIQVGSTSNLFRAGHRIRLEISSSNFPQYDRNLNTGEGVGMGSLAGRITATQTIFHDAEHPSRLVLPIVPR
jgi:hypothetical protein